MEKLDVILSIKDNMSSAIKNAIKKQKQFSNETKIVRKQLQEVSNQKYEINMGSYNMKQAIDKTNRMKSELESLETKIKKVEKAKGIAKYFSDPMTAKLYLNDRQALMDVLSFKRSLITNINSFELEIVLQKDEISKRIEAVKLALSTLGNYVKAPVLLIKDKASKPVAAILSKIRIIGSKIISPLINVKDNAMIKLNKIQSLFKYTKDLIIKPLALRVNDKASNVVTKVKGNLSNIGKMAKPYVLLAKDKASSGITKIKEKFKLIKSSYTSEVSLKDKFSQKFNQVKDGVKKIGSLVAKPVIMIKDKATEALKKIKNSTKELFVKAIASGAQLETQSISINHVMGVNNMGTSKDDIAKMTNDYVNQLKNNANLTPFSTTEVLSAGTTALSATGGNASEAMNLLKIAQDMAAVSPDKSLQEAMNALASMKKGDTEGMKEFGINISSEDVKKAGGTEALIKNQVVPFFEGGSEKLASSASGLVATMKGRIGAVVADTGLGIIENVKPLLENLVNFVEQISPKLQKVGDAIASGFGVGVEWISNLINKAGGVTSIVGVIGNAMSQMGPIFQGIGDMVNRVFPMVADTIGGAFKNSGSGIGIFKNMINDSLPFVEGLIMNLCTAFQIIQPVIFSLVGMVARLFPQIGMVINQAITVAMPFIKAFAGIIQSSIPVVETIISIFINTVSTLMPVISTIFTGVAEKVGTVIEIISGKMEYVKSVFDFVVPLIADVLSTAWSIISPIIDIAIAIFGALLEVVEFVWPTMQGIMETAWGVLKPIFDAVAEAMKWIGDAVNSIIGWFGDVFSGVFDKGAKGSTQESTEDGKSRAIGVRRIPYDNYLINAHEGEMLLTKQEARRYQSNTRGVSITNSNTGISNTLSTNTYNSNQGTNGLLSQGTKQQNSSINIMRLADTIVIEKEADVDKVIERMVSKLQKMSVNMA